MVKILKEDAPVNAVGSGNIAGTGQGLKGEPGVKPGKKSPPLIRRKKLIPAKKVFEDFINKHRKNK